MKIALHNADVGKYPNLALMKLSAYHKMRGDDVEWFSALNQHEYDQILSSKVFTFTPDDMYLPTRSIRGGTGYGLFNPLLEEIEHSCPDYSMYPTMDHSMGFLTRGCNRSCEWCIVPKKEGKIRANADINEFTRHQNVVLLDNNVLAHPHGIAQLEKIARMGLRVDFNQGLDARLIDDQIARRLGAIKWIRCIRLACDHNSQMPAVRRAIEHLRWNNANPARISCYVLIRGISDALERIRFLKGMYVDVFAQPYRDLNGSPPTPEQAALARWVNHKAIYKSVTWENYQNK